MFLEEHPFPQSKKLKAELLTVEASSDGPLRYQERQSVNTGSQVPGSYQERQSLNTGSP